MSNNEFGDFQTPVELVREILTLLSRDGFPWSRILEPTCGQGSFLQGLVELDRPPREVKALEIQPDYVEQARQIVVPPDVEIDVRQADFFQLDLSSERWKSDGPLLVIGNPPWVTNAALGSLGSSNLPEKTNFKQLRGLDALTGKSNFDIAEYIWLKLMSDLRHESPTIGLLCKTSVARNVLKFAQAHGLPVRRSAMYRIDAKRWFGAATDACFFLVDMGSGPSRYEAEVHDSLQNTQGSTRIGFVNGLLVADMDAYSEVEFLEARTAQMEWRQGIKHDAAPVMELTLDEIGWINQAGEAVDVEDDFVFPLIKAGDVRLTDERPRRAVIVPHRGLGESMEHLPRTAPRLWNYLQLHREVFDRRKSSIYRGKQPFSIFGVGPYSFAPYKVIVSGLHKTPGFIVVGPRDGKPFVCDDTCYMLPFHSAPEAACVATALNHEIARQFLSSIVFWDAKRPITKALLKRISLDALVETIPEKELQAGLLEILSSLEPQSEDDRVAALAIAPQLSFGL